jgi:NAD(P)-dependent dehydrogenase (short-subunit alcohol dehydrogenase family)
MNNLYCLVSIKGKVKMRKTAIVLNAKSNIGESMVSLFLKLGWNVLATMVNPSFEDVDRSEKNLLVLKSDIKNSDDITNLVNVAIEEFDDINLILNVDNIDSEIDNCSHDIPRNEFKMNIKKVEDRIMEIIKNQSLQVVEIVSGK